MSEKEKKAEEKGLRIVGQYAYDNQDRAYQWQDGDWVLVCTNPMPGAVDGGRKKITRH